MGTLNLGSGRITINNSEFFKFNSLSNAPTIVSLRPNSGVTLTQL